jgi:hypothetical protein
MMPVSELHRNVEQLPRLIVNRDECSITIMSSEAPITMGHVKPLPNSLSLQGRFANGVSATLTLHSHGKSNDKHFFVYTLRYSSSDVDHFVASRLEVVNKVLDLGVHARLPFAPPPMPTNSWSAGPPTTTLPPSTWSAAPTAPFTQILQRASAFAAPSPVAPTPQAPVLATISPEEFHSTVDQIRALLALLSSKAPH